MTDTDQTPGVAAPCPWCGGETYDNVRYSEAHGAGVCGVCYQCVSVDHDCPCGRALRGMAATDAR